MKLRLRRLPLFYFQIFIGLSAFPARGYLNPEREDIARFLSQRCLYRGEEFVRNYYHRLCFQPAIARKPLPLDEVKQITVLLEDRLKNSDVVNELICGKQVYANFRLTYLTVMISLSDYLVGKEFTDFNLITRPTYFTVGHERSRQLFSLFFDFSRFPQALTWTQRGMDHVSAYEPLREEARRTGRLIPSRKMERLLNPYIANLRTQRANLFPNWGRAPSWESRCPPRLVRSLKKRL